MAGATVTLYTRIPGRQTFGIPVLSGASARITLGTPIACTTYMQHPYGQGDVAWKGSQFGMPAPGGAGAQVQRVTVQVTHHVSDPGSFSSATGQVLNGAAPVGAAAPLTLSATQVTDTFQVTTGYPAAALPNLAVQVSYHATAPSLAYVTSAWASASYSYPAAITGFTIPPLVTMPAVRPLVTLPVVRLTRLGTQVNTLTPAFGQPTTAGGLLAGWAFSNSSSSTFDTTCNDPSWTLAAFAGAAFGWTSLWYKADCGTAETAPQFSSGATTPMSQLAEFAAVGAVLDRAAAVNGTQSYAVTSPGADTRSGDLVVAVYTWGGSNAGPTTITMTGADSSGAALPLTVYDNASSAGTQFWALGWGQAGAGFGPHADSASATMGLFATGQAAIASFTLAGAASPPPFLPGPSMVNRAVTVPGRIG